MLVSVIIPAHGRQRRLELSARSAARQSGISADDIEVIIVDDASPVPLTSPGDLNNVTVLRLPTNVGAAGARNAGISASSGEFIAFLDSDDIWTRDKLANQLKLAKRLAKSGDLSSLAIASAFYMPNRLHGNLEMRIPREASAVRDFVGGCWMCPGSTLLVHRSVFDRIGLFDKRMRRLEDYEWMLRFARQHGRLCVSRYAGAVILPSAELKQQAVAEAVRMIRDKLSNDALPKLPRAERASLESYLELELTASLLSERRRLSALFHLLKSLWLKPRLEPSVEDFWERSSDVSDDAQQLYQDLVSASQKAA